MSQAVHSSSTAPDRGLSDAADHMARTLKRPSLAPVRLSVLAAAIEGAVWTVTFWFILFAATASDAFRPGLAGLAAMGMSVGAVGITAMLRGYHLSRLVRVLDGGLRTLPGLAAMLMLAGILSGASVQAEGLIWAAPVALIAAVFPLRLVLSALSDWAVASGLTARRAVLAGGGVEAERLLRGLASKEGNDIRICGIFDDRGGKRAPDLVLDVPKIGRFDNLVEFCRVAEIDLIILCLPPSADQRIAYLLEKFRVLPVPVHLSAFSQDFAFPDAAGKALLPASFKAERRLAKRAFDLLFGSLMLVLFAPVMVLVALAIRLDSPGPIFFRQDRHGFNDRPIRVWKFRSMYSDQCDTRADRVVTRGDPRVTRVGRVIRKTSLDELPQLFNVLGGSLSLVGPRPHALDARSSRQERFAQIVNGYSARHRLPPGITGWAQIHGWRGEVDDPDSLQHRFAHDLFYIENWSIWLDLAILVRTPLSLLDTRRAY